MKKKIISFAIAFALLSQTMVFAGGLSSLVSGLFGGLPATTSVATTVTGYVKATTDLAYPTTGYNQTSVSNFDYKAGIDMSSVRSAFATYYTFGKSQAVSNGFGTAFDNSDVTGSFTITFTYPSSITGTTPTVAGLNAQFAPTSIFEVTNVGTSVANKLVVSAKVKDATPLKVSTLNANAATALADFALEATNLTASATSTIEVSMTGDVYITETDNTNFAKISFDSNISPVTITVSHGVDGTNSVNNNNSNNNNGGDEPAIQVVSESNESIEADIEVEEDGTYKITPRSLPTEIPGSKSNGWALTPYAGEDENYDPNAPIKNAVPDANGNITLYPRYVNVTRPSALKPSGTDGTGTDETGNAVHNLYIYGYPDGEVKPNGNITREEVTAAFDRLLNEDYRATINTTEHNFPDVNSDRWSNDSIATMAKGGFIVGDENGNFNPSRPITRAEFAVIAAKFAPEDAEVAENYFTDIDGHWAKDFILKIAGQYWISGNPDGTFKPDAYITRAEAMRIINKMLVRYGDVESDYATQWPDVSKSDWFYAAVIEATTTHTYVRAENGWSEKWIKE